MATPGCVTFKILSGETATVAAGTTYSLQAPDYAGPTKTNQFTCQAYVVGTGAVSATVLVDVSNDGTYWEELLEIVLSGTTSDSDGEAAEAPWAFIRGRISAISGTGAAVTCTVGVR